MSIPPPSLFSLLPVPRSQLFVIETLCGNFFLNFLASHIFENYSTESLFSLKNVVGYGIPSILQIVILVLGGIAYVVVIGRHTILPKVVIQYLRLLVCFCTDDDYKQVRDTMDIWRGDGQQVTEAGAKALNEITTITWKMTDQHYSNLLVSIYKSEGNSVPRRSVFCSIINFIENPALALLATAPGTFAINMFCNDIVKSFQHDSSWVWVLAYLIPALVQVAVSVMFRAFGKRKMNRKMFEYLHVRVGVLQDADYEKVTNAMDCWRDHRISAVIC